MWKRLAFVFAAMAIGFSLLYMRVYTIAVSDEYRETASKRGRYVLTVGRTYGNIYDKNMTLLNNNTYEYTAAVNPVPEAVSYVLKYAIDKDDVRNNMTTGLPFLCKVTEECLSTSYVRVFRTVSRTSDNQLAPHIIGYTRDNSGVSGLEYAYDYLLRGSSSATKAVFEINATGRVLDGYDIQCVEDDTVKSGVITTLDADIQRICETAAESIEKGAVVVMTTDGELRAIVSVPDFNPNNLAASLENEDTPFVNRAFSAYNTGSVFKLVTAAAALESGISPETLYTCEGYIDVNGQIFRCHNLSGHGELDMAEAVAESCNTYFISLSEKIDDEILIDTARKLGFGEKTFLANGIASAAGNLQSEEDIAIPAEKANMSFGQGKLTATPVQIARMTAAIANGGKLPQIRLVSGTIDDGELTESVKESAVQAINHVTAYRLRKFMEYAVESENSNARPFNTTAAGKTSTAQTGIYDDDGNEILQAWFTGYFPADKPEYIVTVMVEDGETGNKSAAPVFREIAEEITKAEKGKIAKKAEIFMKNE